jgi:hypothetical protein
VSIRNLFQRAKNIAYLLVCIAEVVRELWTIPRFVSKSHADEASTLSNFASIMITWKTLAGTIKESSNGKNETIKEIYKQLGLNKLTFERGLTNSAPFGFRVFALTTSIFLVPHQYRTCRVTESNIVVDLAPRYGGLAKLYANSFQADRCCGLHDLCSIGHCCDFMLRP